MMRFLLFLGFSILATAVCAADRPINFVSWGDAARRLFCLTV
jgi:hypothetical protein